MSLVMVLAAAAAVQAQPVPEAAAVPTAPPPAAEVVTPEGAAEPSDAIRPEPVNVTTDAAAREGVTPYPAAFFNAYAPNTALDMINRLPGFQFDRGAGNDVRGLAGSAGNVLIDGAAPPASRTASRAS
jgi:hypothetical protein